MFVIYLYTMHIYTSLSLTTSGVFFFFFHSRDTLLEFVRFLGVCQVSVLLMMVDLGWG